MQEEVHYPPEFLTVRGALEHVDYGVALLDGELKSRFINQAFRRFFELPSDKANGGPSFAELMLHGRNTKAYVIPDDRLDAYVDERIGLVQAGDRRPLELRLSSGLVLRFQCQCLPEGGRILTYTDVTESARLIRKLEDMAARDALTNVFNRRQFIVSAEAECRRYQSCGHHLSMIILDIDEFKSINDRFGHLVGDQVIKFIADLCVRNTRNVDVVSRIGGEEFAILLPEADVSEARAIAERLRRLANEQPLLVDQTCFKVTISVGIAGATRAMRGIHDLMKASDDAVYRAKRSGRNRVVVMKPDSAIAPMINVDLAVDHPAASTSVVSIDDLKVLQSPREWIPEFGENCRRTRFSKMTVIPAEDSD